MRTRAEVDRTYEERARKGAAEGVTPAHTATSAAVGAADGEEAARRRRDRVQHEVDPLPPEVPEVAHVDVGKLYDQALDVPVSPAYPAMRPASPEMFRSGPRPGGLIPSGVLSAESIGRPLLTDGRSRACAPEAC